MKNQLVWFKKQPNTTWFDISTPGWSSSVIQLAQTGIIPDSMPKKDRNIPPHHHFYGILFAAVVGPFSGPRDYPHAFCLYHPYVRFQSRC